MWVACGSLILTAEWTYSLPLSGELFRLTHACPGGYGRGLICQASTTLIPDLFDIKRLYYRDEGELFLFERPAPFDERRIGVRSFHEGLNWIISIDCWKDTMPLFPDASNPSANAGTTTTIAASTTSAVVLAANPARKGVEIYNNSSLATLYLSFGATASPTAFAEKISPNTLLELPGNYLGAISGVWSVASGSAQVTEFS